MSVAFEIPTIETEHPVMFFDTDCAAVVHNLAYLRFIEHARTLLAEQMGMRLAEMASTGIYPVLLNTEIQYKRTAKLGDKLVVRGRLESMERVRFWCRFEVVRPADEVVMCTCRQSLALIRMPQAKPMRLPEDWMQKYAHLSGEV